MSLPHRFQTGFLIAAALLIQTTSLFAYDTIGNGYGSKWGEDPNAGTGAIVTWGYMPDGTTLDPNGFPFNYAITGTSNITAIRNSVDVNYGASAFNQAIQNAFNTWSAVANITFVGPITDPGLPVGSTNAITPNIRIGAFQAVPGQFFDHGSAIGLGPPGPSGAAFFPESGDVIFNVAGIGTQRPYQIAPGTEDVTPVDVYDFGDDVEGVFLHELGHAAIGLNHPRWAGSNPDQRVMYVGDFDNPSAPYCCQALNRQLDPDDIAAAQYVYGIRGDFNRDGRVDTADYVLWRNTNGQSITPGTGADANVDGIVNQLDYNEWRANFGNAQLLGFGEQVSFGVGAVASVPEPPAVILITLAIAVAYIARPSRPATQSG